MTSARIKKIKDALSTKKVDDLTFERDSSAENIVKAITYKNGLQHVVKLFVISEEDFDKILNEQVSSVVKEKNNGKVMSV